MCHIHIERCGRNWTYRACGAGWSPNRTRQIRGGRGLHRWPPAPKGRHSQRNAADRPERGAAARTSGATRRCVLRIGKRGVGRWAHAMRQTRLGAPDTLASWHIARSRHHKGCQLINPYRLIRFVKELTERDHQECIMRKCNMRLDLSQYGKS